jgi:MFS family permease
MTFTDSPRMPRSVHAIAVGRGISFLGDEVALLAMAFRAKAELGHFGVAAILIAGALPLLLLAPISGLIVDRVRARPLLVGVTLAQAALCAALAFSPAALLVPFVALLACGTSISVPAWQALVPTLVTDVQLPSAMGLLQSVQAFAGIAGPFVGGFLVAWYGFHVPLVIDAVSFLALALIPIVLRVDRVPSKSAAQGSSKSEALVGVRLILGNPMLRAILALVVCFILAIGAINVVEIYFITTALHAGARGYGLLGASMGIGMLVTAAFSGRLAKRFTSPERMFVVGCVGLCAGLLLFGLTGQLWEAIVLLAFVGASNALVNVNAMVLVTRSSTDEVRGRVFSAIQGTVSAAQIAALAIGGLLLLEFAPRPIILVGSAASALALAFTVRPVLLAGRTVEATDAVQATGDVAAAA